MQVKLFLDKKHAFHVNQGKVFCFVGARNNNLTTVSVFIKLNNRLRIRFGKTALKCVECLGTCHVECKFSMPIPCVPTCRTPTRFVGSIADHSPKSAPMIPSLIIYCIEEIEARGVGELGIYRATAADKEVIALKVLLRSVEYFLVIKISF